MGHGKTSRNSARINRRNTRRFRETVDELEIQGIHLHCMYVHSREVVNGLTLKLAAASTLKRYSKALEYEYRVKRYSKALEYEYRVKTTTLDTLKRYSILSLTLYLEWYSAYSILYSSRPH
jgi:hypothetical protein